MSPTLAVLLLSITIVTGQIYFRGGSPHVQLTETSGLTGHTKFSRDGRPFVSFEGILFAKVQERFAPSELVTEPEWTGLRDATTPGDMCVQLGGLGREDCLTLSVHVPLSVTKRNQDYPVLVYIHGGDLLTRSM